jgi:hypothetical protein
MPFTLEIDTSNAEDWTVLVSLALENIQGMIDGHRSDTKRKIQPSQDRVKEVEEHVKALVHYGQPVDQLTALATR